MSRSNTDRGKNQLITGLTNRRHYEVQVAAVNRISRGNYASATGTPQEPPEPPPESGLPEISVGVLGAYWTDSFGSNAMHADSTGRNTIENSCVGAESFKVFWAGPSDGTPFSNPIAAEWDAHVITREGAGEVSYSFRNEYGGSQFVGMYGTVNLNGVSILTIRVRGRVRRPGLGPVVAACQPVLPCAIADTVMPVGVATSPAASAGVFEPRLCRSADSICLRKVKAGRADDHGQIQKI